MHGVVSLLDEANYAHVENLWHELERRFGVRGVFVTPYPHFSYHISADYDLAQLEKKVDEIAAETAVFPVRATGLGIFPGPQPVLYLPVVRNAALAALHRRLWQALRPVSRGASDYYAPAEWLPHVTLSAGDTTAAALRSIVPWLLTQDLTLEITVDNLSVIYDSGDGQRLYRRCPLQPRA